MSDVIRTPTRAGGGLTDAEKVALVEYVKTWVANAMQTGRTDRPALKQAIAELYEVSGLKRPIVCG